MKLKIGLFALLLLLSVIAYAVFKIHASPNTMPDLNFISITGKQFGANSLRGKPILITFWATDCPSCVRDINHLIELHQRYHTRQGLEIIAVAMAYNPPHHVVAMTKAKAIPYNVVLDLNSNYAHAFGDISLTPNSFLIAPDGTIVLHKLGLLNIEKIEALLNGF